MSFFYCIFDQEKEITDIKNIKKVKKYLDVSFFYCIFVL